MIKKTIRFPIAVYKWNCKVISLNNFRSIIKSEIDSSLTHYLPLLHYTYTARIPSVIDEKFDFFITSSGFQI
jgi:hypothetical protein